MTSDVANFVIEEFPSSKPVKTLTKSKADGKSTKPRLPEKDKKFIEEFNKRNFERRILKPSKTAFLSETQTIHFGLSVNPDRSRRERNFGKHTASSDFKSTSALKDTQSRVPLQLLHSTGSLEKKNIIDLSYKFFVGNGNNDSLVKRILTERSGWVKAFTPHSSNLIWTEVKQFGIFELIPSTIEQKYHKRVEVLHENNKQGSPEDAKAAALNDKMKVRIYNKLEGNKELACKKRLFYNMTSYYRSVGESAFKRIPLTFHISEGTKDPVYAEFVKKFNDFQKELPNDSYLNNCWIVKPGESTNRGIGITVCSSIDEVAKAIEDKKSGGNFQRTYIVQKYLYRPLLYYNRKFDIRCYTLITIINGNFQAYFFKEGYMRTSCQEFNMENIKDRFIHLTNDAVQKNSPDYGRFEDGNKVSYDIFQEYIDGNLENKVDLKAVVHPKIKRIVLDTIKATHKKLDPRKRNHTFEILGYDFMLDEMYNPWLLEVNTNPCLALSGKYLAELIPKMLNEAFTIVLDELFPAEGGPVEKSGMFEPIFTSKRC